MSPQGAGGIRNKLSLSGLTVLLTNKKGADGMTRAHEMAEVHPLEQKCPVEVTIEVLHGKWKPLILFYLLDGTKRFGALQRLLPQVTRRMLTQHLRELERDGIVHREVYTQVPPRVEYSLTETGRSLEPVLMLMLSWGQQYAEQGHVARSESRAS